MTEQKRFLREAVRLYDGAAQLEEDGTGSLGFGTR